MPEITEAMVARLDGYEVAVRVVPKRDSVEIYSFKAVAETNSHTEDGSASTVDDGDCGQSAISVSGHVVDINEHFLATFVNLMCGYCGNGSYNLGPEKSIFEEQFF